MAENLRILTLSSLGRRIAGGVEGLGAPAAKKIQCISGWRSQCLPRAGLPGNEKLLRPVERIATERGVAMATVALAWVMKNPVVNSPIVGATKAKHLTDAAAALEIRLTDEEVAALEDPYTPRESTFFSLSNSKPHHRGAGPNRPSTELGHAAI